MFIFGRLLTFVYELRRFYLPKCRKISLSEVSCLPRQNHHVKMAYRFLRISILNASETMKKSSNSLQTLHKFALDNKFSVF